VSGALQRLLLVNVACMGGATMFIFLNAYLIAHGMEKWQIGIGDAGFWIVSVLLQPWLGPNLDTRGRVIFVRGGALLLALAALGYALAPPTMLTILPLRILQGAGFALYLTAAWAWVSDHAPPEKMHAIFGFFGLSSLVGSLFGPVAAQLLRGSQPPHQDRLVFFGAASVLGLAFLVLWTIRDAATRGAGHHHHGAPSGEEEEATDAPSTDSLWALAKRPRLRGAVVGSLSFGLAVGSIFAFAAAYLESLGVHNVSTLFVVLTVVAALGRGFCGKLSKRFGTATLIAPCLLALALGSAGLGAQEWLAQPNIALMLLAGGAAGLGYGVVYPLLNAIAYERLHASERGRGMSLVAACIDSGNSFGAVVAGLVAQNFGEGKMFLAMGAAVALTAILSRIVDRR
jgi:MFS family permease